MKTTMTGWCAALVVLLSGGPLLAHHSLANHDTATAVRVKGVIVQVNLINPHSIIYLEERNVDGLTIRRWAIEGPSGVQLARMGFADLRNGQSIVKVGDVIEVCGYQPKEATTWQIASTDPKTVSLAGRLITAEMLVLPDGKVQSWGDYGFHHCFPPDYRDQHSR